MSTYCLRRFITKQVLASKLIKIGKQGTRATTHHQRVCSEPGGWQVVSAVCLERLPVTTRPLTDLENRYAHLQKQVEFEKSVLSDHELRHMDDMAIAEKRRRDEIEETEVARQTALELEDSWEVDIQAYRTGDAADVEGTGERSLKRELDKTLILLVKEKVGDEELWVLPGGRCRQGDTLRQTAEGVLDTVCGSHPQARLISNAPSACYDYLYPQAMQTATGCAGAKVFIHKAIWNKGDNCEPRYVDYKWVTKPELRRYLKPRYGSVVSDIVLSL